MAENNLENMLTVEEAAGLLRLKPNTLRIRIRAGKLRAFKFGKRWYIPREAIREAMRPSGRPRAGEDDEGAA